MKQYRSEEDNNIYEFSSSHQKQQEHQANQNMEQHPSKSLTGSELRLPIMSYQDSHENLPNKYDKGVLRMCSITNSNESKNDLESLKKYDFTSFDTIELLRQERARVEAAALKMKRQQLNALDQLEMV